MTARVHDQDCTTRHLISTRKEDPPLTCVFVCVCALLNLNSKYYAIPRYNNGK
jgi:hypothetical protein